MASVTQRIKEIKQPTGGYVNIKEFKCIKLKNLNELNPLENIHPTLIGLAVDYLSRFMVTKDVVEAFKVSSLGAFLVNEKDKFIDLISDIKGLDNKSIINAVKVCGYDVAFRAGPIFYKPVDTINPDFDTIENIRIMVNRSLFFFNTYGPITADGFTFEGGYSKVVDTGDGDFLTKDTLWDFKVSKAKPTKEHTLQLLMYYIMGKKSGKEIFKNIRKIGIFNPRLNEVYIYEIGNEISDVLTEISTKVICYK